MRAGEVFQLSRERYSDYSIGEGMRALDDFDFDTVWCEWLDVAKAKADADDGYFTAADAATEFVDHLIARGLAERFPITELWVGEYGRFERSPEADLRKRQAQNAEMSKVSP